MMANRFVAGVVAGLAISAVGLIYSLLRKDQMVGLFMQAGEGEPAMSASAASWMLFGSMLFMGPFLGLLAALVYGWLPSPTASLISSAAASIPTTMPTSVMPVSAIASRP